MTDRYQEIRDALAMGPTPGPRTLLADEGILGRSVPGRWAVESDGAYICLDPEWDEEFYEESIANAALIAACDPDTIRALLAERDALREALTECLRVNETDAGDDVAVWANAMLVARAALAQAPRACTCHPDDRPDGPCRERYAAIDAALAAEERAHGITED